MTGRAKVRTGWDVAGQMVFLLVCVLLSSRGNCQTVASTPVDFAREIRPLLVRYCISCHWPNRAKNDLRLDSRDAALKGGKAGKAANVHGDAAKSELTRRIISDDTDELMPPKGGRLTSAQASLIQRWIEQGAVWPDAIDARHWAFVPPVRPSIPTVK